MCSYYSKGAADYVGVWDFDEFFQPRGKYKNILNILDDMEDPTGLVRNTYPEDADPVKVYKSGYKSRRGMADEDGHHFCYLLLDSEVTLIDNIIPFADMVCVACHCLFHHTVTLTNLRSHADSRILTKMRD